MKLKYTAVFLDTGIPISDVEIMHQAKKLVRQLEKKPAPYAGWRSGNCYIAARRTEEHQIKVIVIRNYTEYIFE
jgi:hypothetical protein